MGGNGDDDDAMEVDTDYDDGAAQEQGNAGEDTADDGGAGYGADS